MVRKPFRFELHPNRCMTSLLLYVDLDFHRLKSGSVSMAPVGSAELDAHRDSLEVSPSPKGHTILHLSAGMQPGSRRSRSTSPWRLRGEEFPIVEGHISSRISTCGCKIDISVTLSAKRAGSEDADEVCMSADF